MRLTNESLARWLATSAFLAVNGDHQHAMLMTSRAATTFPCLERLSARQRAGVVETKGSKQALVLRAFGRAAVMLAMLELSLLEIRPSPFTSEISVLVLMRISP